MKKTMNVNIGSVAFTIDEDAYLVVKEYLEDVESRLDEDARDEVMQDVESRIADILSNKLSVPGQVVSLEMVKQTISVIGRAEYFGERHRSAAPPPPPPVDRAARPHRLYRSRSQKAIAGLCGGIAEYFDWDVTMVRVITLLLVLFGGLSLWVYFILWIVIPMEPVQPYEEQYYNRKQSKR